MRKFQSGLYTFLLPVVILSLLISLPLSSQDCPNIILIMTDDQGWFDAGFNGNASIQTPNIDRLARNGIILDRFYSASAVCSPTRASVITGRNPYRMGIPGANSGHMKKEEITIAELLREEGYSTGHFGKWHLGTLTRKEKDANRGGKEKFMQHFSIPSMHGYDEFFCTESKVPTYDPLIRPAEFEGDESLRFGWTAVKETDSVLEYNTAYWVGEEIKAIGELRGDDTKVIMDHVVPFIHNSVRQDKPFFTTIWPHTPHLPVVANEEYKRKYAGFTERQQIYYGCITALDAQIGRLWEELENLGIADNTMIWYCSDNGPENGTPGSAGPFRERKRSLHEGGLRTPAFVIWKNRWEGGKRVEFPAFTSDYLPTILSILGISYPDDRPVDGTDLTPFISQPNLKREKPLGFMYRDKISWVNHQYKLISKNNGESYELYDLLDDKKEQFDIIDNNPLIAERMLRELNQWMSSVENSNKGNDYNRYQ